MKLIQAVHRHWLATMLLACLSMSLAGCKERDATEPSNPALRQGPQGTPKEVAKEGPGAAPKEVAKDPDKPVKDPDKLAPSQTPPAAPSTNEATMGAVLASALNVRSSPNTQTPPLGQLHCGDIISLSGKDGLWYKIRLGELTGYSHGSYIVEVTPGQGRVPTCEFDHAGIKPKKSKPQPIPAAPTSNAEFAAAVRKKPDIKPVPEKESVIEPQPAPEPKPEVKPEVKPAPTPKPEKAVASVAAPKNLTLSASGIKGTIDFPHLMHAKVVDCVKCHHPLDGAGPGPNLTKNCHNCHKSNGKGSSPVSSKDAFHQTCRACHEAQGKGPTACGECHTGLK